MGKNNEIWLVILVAAIVLLGLYLSGYFSIVSIYTTLNYSNTPTKDTFLPSESPSFILQNEEWTQTYSSPNPYGYCIMTQIKGITVDGVAIANPDSSVHSYFYTMTNDVPKTIPKGALTVAYSIPPKTEGTHTIVVTTWSKLVAPASPEGCGAWFSSLCADPRWGSPCARTFTDTFTVSPPPAPQPPAPNIDFWSITGIINYVKSILCQYFRLFC